MQEFYISSHSHERKGASLIRYKNVDIQIFLNHEYNTSIKRCLISNCSQSIPLADFTHVYGSISQNASAVNGFVYFARNDANLWLPPQLDVKDWSAGGENQGNYQSLLWYWVLIVFECNL